MISKAIATVLLMALSVGCAKDEKGATGRTIEGTNGENAVTGINIQIAGDLAGLDLDDAEKFKMWGWYTYPANSSVSPGENAAASGTAAKSPVVQQIASYASGAKLTNILHFTVENTPTRDTGGAIMYIGTYTYHLEIESIEGYECTIDHTSGLISDLGGVDVDQSDFTINSTCTTTYAASTGSVKGHSGPVTLKMKDGSTVTVDPGKTKDEAVAFDLPLDQFQEFQATAAKAEELKAHVREHFLDTADVPTGAIASKGKGYTVEVVTPPSGQSCVVTPGAQEWDSELRASAGSDKVAYHRQRLPAAGTVQVVCSDVPGFAIGGTVTDLDGDLVLQLNDGNDLTVSTDAKGDADFSFKAKLAEGAAYTVKVLTQPANQTCTVTGGTGKASKTSAEAVSIACEDNAGATYALKVAVTGLSGGTLRLRNNINLNGLDVTTNGTHTFSQAITANDGYDYDVRVLAQPSGQICVITDGADTASTDVTVAISCSAAPTTYTVGGEVQGLQIATQVVLRLTYGVGNTTEDLTVMGNGMDPLAFEFLAGLPTGTTYSVDVQTDPMGADCEVTAGDSDTIGSANKTDVVVTCN